MPSRREQILTALVAALDQAGKPHDALVERYATQQAEADARITVYWVPESTERSHESRFGPIAHRKLLVRCRLDRRQSVDAGPPDAATDALYLWTVRRVLTDPTVQDLVEDIQEQSFELLADTFDQRYVRGYVDFLVEYATHLTDPAALPGEPTDEGD